MRSPVYFILFVGVVLSSCEKKPEAQAALYDVDSLIAVQVNLLSELKTNVEKKASLNGKESVTKPELKDSAAWAKELDIFREIDLINKPINRKAYAVEDEIRDTKSNLTIKSISTREKLPVKYLRVYYQEELQKVKRLEAYFQEENSLYISSKYMTMEFQEVSGKSTLTSYSIQGGQKMVMDDSVQFNIQASITIPN